MREPLAMRHFPSLLTAAVLFALLPATAGAQAPPQLLDRYFATGDPALLARSAEEIAMLPDGYPKRLLTARLRLAEGKLEAALDEARKRNAEAPDDLDAYALIVDAALPLGKTSEAERAAQWMLDLRDRDPRSLTRAAAVREHLNDHTGAREMLVNAYQATPNSDTQLRASILTDAARLAWKLDRKPEAEQLLERATKLLPGYLPAARLAKLMKTEKQP
ncbi:MAG: tetratricopeptide repeat protein [Bryobacteraceae bacterium]|nr:tetratricopeptide repeat protein [Bryobacteraceae bacterium]